MFAKVLRTGNIKIYKEALAFRDGAHSGRQTLNSTRMAPCDYFYFRTLM